MTPETVTVRSPPPCRLAHGALCSARLLVHSLSSLRPESPLGTCWGCHSPSRCTADSIVVCALACNCKVLSDSTVCWRKSSLVIQEPPESDSTTSVYNCDIRVGMDGPTSPRSSTQDVDSSIIDEFLADRVRNNPRAFPVTVNPIWGLISSSAYTTEVRG